MKVNFNNKREKIPHKDKKILPRQKSKNLIIDKKTKVVYLENFKFKKKIPAKKRKTNRASVNKKKEESHNNAEYRK